ncbi:CoA transferase [Mumia sp. DW29H23]|uniref:CoA transferase n=1 Tax=Mumia sp. DW29H23 TaxID=3421241 RepID=UPI003D681B44
MPPLTAPLSGITVLAFEQAVSAPYATRVLADLGARVIKVERPGTGDFTRWFDQDAGGLATHFVWLNRNKESIALDVKDPAARPTLEALLDRADVVIQNLAPGAAARLGLDAESLVAARPHLVAVDISGYGHDGPNAHRRAYDLLVQAESGSCASTGWPGHPARPAIPSADVGSGLMAAVSVLAALQARHEHGRGAALRISMFDVATDFLGFSLLHALYTGQERPPHGMSSPTVAPYASYPTRDGRSVVLGTTNDGEWQRLTRDLVGRNDLAENPDYATNDRRWNHTDAINAEIARWTVEHDAEEICALADRAGIGSAVLRSVPEAARHPEIVERDRWTQVDSSVGPVASLRAPIESPAWAQPLNGVPGLGEHTDAILAELGLSSGTEHLRDGLEHWAATDPSRTALVDPVRSWSYGELEQAVAVAVGRLRRSGVRPGSAVLIVAPVSAAAVVAYLAVLRTGATAVLLDRRCGDADVRHAVAPYGADLVVSTRDLVARLGLDQLGAEVRDLDRLGTEGDPDRTWLEPDPSARAAVFFTSGTTSRPKAVLHALRTLRAGARNMATTLGFGERDSAFLSSPVASITGVMHVHLAVDNGGSLVLEDRFDPPQSLRRVLEHGCTTLGGAPIIAEELFREARRQQLDSLPIRAVALGGAMIPRDLLELATDRWGIVASRVYGSSEAPVATYSLPSDTGDARLVDDGALGPGTEIAIDPSGEVLVRGPMLFLGYADATDQAEAFTDEGWFRTGDLGRLVHDAHGHERLVVTGRLKEVVVRKGLKVSLPEVDEAARLLPDIEEAAAYAVPDAATGERLALAVRPAPGTDVSLDGVTHHLRVAGLATHKLPEEVVVWDAPLPRTATGKVQRRALTTGGARRLLAARLRDSSNSKESRVDDTTGARYARVSTLMADYAVLVDSRDAEGWADVFMPDGVLTFAGRRVEGREALVAFGAASTPGIHLGGSPTITEDGDVLRVRSQFVFVPSDGSGMLAGSYHDRVVDDGTTARLAERAIEIVSHVKGPRAHPRA